MASMAIPKNTKSRFATEIVPVQPDDAIIAPLLSRAYLLKTRGQWDEAIAICTDAVRRSPSSPSPYALLGDIYHAQNKTDDALHWYHMALERNPHLKEIAEKHDALLADKRATATGNFVAATLAADKTARLPAPTIRPVNAQVPPPPDRITAERTIEWLDRVFPPGRSEGMTRLLIAVGAIVGLLVVVTGLFLFFAFNKADGAITTPELTQSPALRPSGESSPPPVSRQESLAAATLSAVATDTNTEPTPVPSLMERLSRVVGEGYSISAAQSNQQRSQVQLEITLVFTPGETTVSTRNRILQASAKATETAFTVEPTAQRFLVRVILQGRPRTGFSGTSNGSLVFVGETSAIALKTLRTTSPVPDGGLLSASFTNTWWADGLRITAQ